MPDGRFDRSRRSDASPPTEAAAKILAAARRTTWRWTLPLVAAAALTVTALAVLGFLVTGHEQYVPPATGTDFAAPMDGIAVDTEFSQSAAESTILGPEANRRRPVSAPPRVDLPDLREEALLNARKSAEAFPEITCDDSAAHRGPDSSDRQDVSEFCIDAIRLYIGSEPGSEPSRLPEPDS